MANKNNNKSIDVSYVFPETISKKSGDLYSKFPGIDELTIYEEPRWSFKDHLNNEVMNYLKENDNDLYEEIIEYQKEHPDGFYFDVGKSLRYDDLLFWWQGGDCSLETLEDKLDDLFIVRYSAEGLDGNLGNPDEIHIRDEKLVSKLNSMIKEHVQNNIDRYNEYKKIRSELVDKELADKHNNALDVYYEEDLKAYSDYAPLPEKTNPENQIIRVQEGQLTTELEVLLDLNKEGDLTHNFGWFKYAELDKNGVLVKDYPVGIWDQRQDEKGNPLNPPKIDTKDISQVIFSKELREKIDSNLKKKIDEVSQTLMRENFENNIHNGKFTDFNAEKVVESMKNKTFKEFEAIGSFEAGNCNFNLWITKGGVPEEPWIDISPIRTIGGTDINGTVSLSLSDIMEPTETLSVEEQIKNTILRKIDELDSPEDTQKTILTVLGKNYDELNKNKNWVWKDYDDLSGHLESPDGKSYFSYDWTTKEYKTTPESSWDSFIDADPTRDTSLASFKKYAENFVRNNIAKDNDIVFERKYIDTSKEMEGETMSNETLADKYNRMNKLFEERKSREGSGNPLTFEELYKWTEEEFPEKDSSEVLRETVGRMIMDNVSHEEFNVEYYDDVYGFGDGADFRWDLSFKAADALLSGDALTLSDAQELIYKESNKMFEELKQNPNYKNKIELTDRINAAFRISKNLYPDFAKLYEHDVPEDGFYNYTKADKKAYIEKAWETIQKEYGNTLTHHRVADLRTDGIDLKSEDKKVKGEILTADLVSLIKGHDAVLYGEKSLNFIRPNKENIELAFENNWSEFDAITKGYSPASSSSIKDAVNIEKIDDMAVFDSDVTAAKQYGIDHNVPIFEEKQTIWIGDDNNEYYSYPDTPENRKVLKDYLIDEPVKEKFDWSEFTEKDFELLKRNLDNPAERMYGSVYIGSISCDLQYREGDKFDLDFYVLGDEGYGGEIEFDEIGIPYSENAITSLYLDEIKDMSYDQFKDWYQDILIKNIEEENYTYEARRPTVNWSNEEQCRELYRTKLIESARLNEIVIAPYTHDEEHQRDVEVIRQWLSDTSKLPVNSISDGMVFAVIDNIGRVQDDKPGDFLKVLKDGTVEHISATNEIKKEPEEILSIINSFAEEHAAVAEDGSEQRKDYEYVNFLYNTVFKNYLNRDDRSSYSEAENIIKEQLEKLSGIKVDDSIADEIYFRYKEHELIGQPIQYLDSYKFRVLDEVENKYLNPVSAAELLEQTLAWNEKELSELHPGTADDEMIAKIKSINEELEHVSDQIACTEQITSLDFNSKEHAQKVKEMLGKDFIISYAEAKVLLTYATHFDDGTHEYGLNKDGQLYFKTNQDREGWSFCTEESMQREFLTSTFDGAAILLDSDRKNDADLLNCFLYNNRTLLSVLDNNMSYKSSLKDIKEKIKEINEDNKKFVVTHSVTFPCGFTFPKEIYENDPGEIKREEYRWKIYERIKEKFGFNDNDTETEYFKGNIPSDSSFNIAFAVSVPKEIKTDAEKVNEWIKSVENFVKDECGCTFINWQGSERLERIYSSEKAYRMEEELKNDLGHPSSKVFEKANVNEIKEYCDIRYNIELTDVQTKEIYDFYNMNNRYTLEASSAGNLYIRNHHEETIVTANAELLKAGNYLRSIKDDKKKSFEYLLKTFDELEIPSDDKWFDNLLEQASYESGERLRFVSDVLSTSFATLDRHDEFWKTLLDYGADPTRAIRIAAADANLGDNLNWLLDHIPEKLLKEIFSDNGYADTVFDIAKESVTNDEGSWQHSHDIGFAGFKRIAVLCGRETDADRYYGECLEKLYKVSVEPKISKLIETPELLVEKMNEQRIHQNEPKITEEQAKAILDYCNYEDIKFYLDKNGAIYSLDISEDYTGEGIRESNFGIVTNGIEYANKAKDYNYSIYSDSSYNVVKDLWEKERHFANPAREEAYANNKVPTFENDIDKMYDFDKISKEEFLASYSYISEEEYDATAKYLKDNNLSADEVVEQLKAKGEKLSDPIPDYYTDIPAEIEKDNQMKEEPVEIIKKVASEKEAAEVPEKFKTEFRNRMISRAKSPDPFIVARAILKEWQTSKPEYVPVLNEYLRSQGCTTEAGFEKFFKTINTPETKQERKLYNDRIHER